jgi:hypothetical protein
MPVNRAWINVYVNDFGLRRKLVERAGHTIIEAHADGDNQIGFRNRHVCPVGAVHAEHAERQLMPRRETAQSHQGRRNRQVQAFGQLKQFIRAVRVNDAAADIKNRAARFADLLNRLTHGFRVALLVRLIAGQEDALRIIELGRLGSYVFRDVNQDGAGSARACDVKRFFDHVGQVAHVFDQVVVLGAGPRDADGVSFLKRIGADQLARHLPADDDQRRRIHVSIGNAGYGIGRAGA